MSTLLFGVWIIGIAFVIICTGLNDKRAPGEKPRGICGLFS